jgi:hypothetical protein
MPIQDFRGKTFVAFIDICGFKEMMISNPKKAEVALDNFYRIVNQEAAVLEAINCIAVSDSAIVFVGTGRSETSLEDGRDLKTIELGGLLSILRFVKQVALKMIGHGIAITGSISFGSFQYQKRIEGPQTVKAMLLGSAYLNAYSDVEDGKPKLRPGQIRVRPIKKIRELLETSTTSDSSELALLKKGLGGYYFYWMLNSMGESSNFEREYHKQYNKMYDAIVSILKNYASVYANRSIGQH